MNNEHNSKKNYKNIMPSPLQKQLNLYIMEKKQRAIHKLHRQLAYCHPQNDRDTLGR